jgi:hypothetical protein
MMSIDALHDADPATLNTPVRRLHRFVRMRRILFYSVLWPFSAVSRHLGTWIVPVTVALALGSLFALTVAGAPPVLVVLLATWGVGGSAFMATSMLMVSRLDAAAESVGLTGGEVLASWAEQS